MTDQQEPEKRVATALFKLIYEWKDCPGFKKKWWVKSNAGLIKVSAVTGLDQASRVLGSMSYKTLKQ